MMERSPWPVYPNASISSPPWKNVCESTLHPRQTTPAWFPKKASCWTINTSREASVLGCPCMPLSGPRATSPIQTGLPLSGGSVTRCIARIRKALCNLSRLVLGIVLVGTWHIRRLSLRWLNSFITLIWSWIRSAGIGMSRRISLSGLSPLYGWTCTLWRVRHIILCGEEVYASCYCNFSIEWMSFSECINPATY